MSESFDNPKKNLWNQSREMALREQPYISSKRIGLLPIYDSVGLIFREVRLDELALLRIHQLGKITKDEFKLLNGQINSTLELISKKQNGIPWLLASEVLLRRNEYTNFFGVRYF